MFGLNIQSLTDLIVLSLDFVLWVGYGQSQNRVGGLPTPSRTGVSIRNNFLQCSDDVVEKERVKKQNQSSGINCIYKYHRIHFFSNILKNMNKRIVFPMPDASKIVEIFLIDLPTILLFAFQLHTENLLPADSFCCLY